jgi:hypothetical protein
MRGIALFMLLLITFWLTFMPSMIAVPREQSGAWLFAMAFGLPGTLQVFAFWILYLLVIDWLTSEIELPWGLLAFVALVAIGLAVDIGMRYGFRLEDVMRPGRPEPSPLFGRYVPIFAGAVVALLHRTVMRLARAA